MRYAFTLAALAAAVTALPAVSQIADGQVQAPTGYPVTQIADGQIQAPTGHPVTQIADGQIQAPGPKATGSPVQQIPDGQVQQPKSTGKPVSQIPDGQVQAPGKASASKAPAPPAYTSPAASTLACPVPTAKASKGPGASKPQVPFKFPLANGFPSPNATALAAIQKTAQGTLPNGALPKTLSDASAANLQLIAFNEIFEVAYFNSLLANLTSGEYNIGAAKDFVVTAINTIQAQEQLHAIGANAILASANRTTILPCQYKFPVSDFDSAIATAGLFTDVVLGTLQAAQGTFATTGDAALVPLVGSIIGQEGEQVGYYRVTGRKVPSAQPFLTASAGAFAWSALNQLFVVPGTCGNFDVLTKALGQPLSPLTVVTPPPATGGDATVTYSYPVVPQVTSPENLRLVLINGQNAPIVQPLNNLKRNGNTVTFDSPFPYTNATLNGLTIAAVTNGKTSFATVAEAAAAAVWGPGLIEVN